ncbi:TonB-dependent receptor plug domain-containing protein [Orenia marismortui]|uniref:TonB-dependent receptor plug domain-containing protein n=1 Tax=Orenia marismortui TaxID=46469 RepID=UPI000375E152|nr:TonB-dependent receptor [Orenia marismortui]
MKNYRRILASISLFFLLIGLTTTAVTAEESGSDEQEYTLVVTANRIAVKETEAGADVTVITSEDIEEGGFVNLEQILSESNVNMETDPTGSTPILNGDRRVLVMIDGRRMNWDFVVKSGSKGGVDFNNIPIENIERIEVVRGAGSSLYGSDAVGGVINIITKEATEPRVSFSQETGSWGFMKHSLTAENKFDNGLGFYITGEVKEQDDFEYKEAKTGKIKTMDQSYYDQKSLTLSLDQELNNQRSLSLQFDYTDRNFGFSWAPEGYSSGDVYYYPDGNGTSVDNNIALTYNLGSDSLVRIYRNSSKKEIDYGNGSGYDLDNIAIGGDWQQSSTLTDSHKLVYGTEWRQTDSDYSSQGINNSYITKALYLQDQWQVTDQWTLTAGSRYDDHSIIGGHSTSNLTANREINNDTNFYLSWGQFVKAPLVEDLFSDTQWMVGNPDLNPETGDTITLGLNTELGKGTKLQTSIFSSQLEDAISYGTSDDGRTLAINIDRQKKYGFDLNLSCQLSYRWNLAMGYSYLKIENKDGADSDYYEDLDNSTPHGYHMKLRYDQDLWNAELALQGANGRSLERFTSESYLTVDMRVNYHLDNKTKLVLKGNNLTNEAYEVRSSGSSGWVTPGAYAMPARNVYLGIERKF